MSERDRTSPLYREWYERIDGMAMNFKGFGVTVLTEMVVDAILPLRIERDGLIASLSTERKRVEELTGTLDRAHKVFAADCDDNSKIVKRLEAEVQRLRAALDKIQICGLTSEDSVLCSSCSELIDEALGGGGE